MRIEHYAAANAPPSTQDFASPSWEIVEQAIRRLDGHHYPSFWLFRTVPRDDEFDFAILSGSGACAIFIEENGRTLKFHNPSAADAVIPVWTSDQGASFPASEVCTDVTAATAAAKHFFDTGSVPGFLDWAPVD